MINVSIVKRVLNTFVSSEERIGSNSDLHLWLNLLVSITQAKLMNLIRSSLELAQVVEGLLRVLSQYIVTNYLLISACEGFHALIMTIMTEIPPDVCNT